MIRIFLLLFLLVFFCWSCTSFRESPKYSFSDGMYNSSLVPDRGNDVYIEVLEDTITAWRAKREGKEIHVERDEPAEVYPDQVDHMVKPSTFYKPSFDIDFITIPVRYRPAAAEIPRQLTTGLSGALYIGSRYDVFRINYNKNPLGVYHRDINHYGFSIGLFTGLGSMLINPENTRDQVPYEYEGVLWLKGVSALFGFNNFTTGLAVGTDTLLDGNRRHWIYQEKLWLGIVFGLNLN